MRIKKSTPLEAGQGHFATNSLPRKGIYVLYENGDPIYVGRSDNIKQRLSQHKGSDRFGATFAFRLAVEEYEQKYAPLAKRVKRQELEEKPEFQEIFIRHKERVARMQTKAISIDDPIEQTIFEVYAAVKLNTLKYNSFENH